MRLFKNVAGGFYATAFEVQIGCLWFGIKYPSFWLWSSNRHRFFNERRAEWGTTCRCHRCRGWLYAFPGFVRWLKDDEL